MKNYQLQINEVVRFQAQITLQTDKGDIPAELLLTDLNFIFVTECKNFLWFKRKPRWTAFAKELVKTYKEAPQIKQTDTSVKICFSTEDRVIVFENKKEARDFVINAWETVTGKTAFERNIDKLKQALDCIDDILEIDIRALIKSTLENRLALTAVGALNKMAHNLLPKVKGKKIKALKQPTNK